MKIKIYLATIFWIFTGFLSAHAQGSPCKCGDKRNLQNLLNITDSVIQKLQVQIDQFVALEAATTILLPYSDEGYEELLSRLYGAIADVNDPNNKWVKFREMDAVSCELPDLTGESPCMRKIAEQYYATQHKLCLLSKGSRGDQSYRRTMSMKELAVEKMVAYNEMRKTILPILSSFPRDCRPGDWFGYVFYENVTTSVINETLPPLNTHYPRPGPGTPIRTGGNKTQGIKFAYFETIFVESGKASGANARATYKYDDSTIVSGRDYCSGKRPDVPVVQTSGTSAYQEGSYSDIPDFRITMWPATRKYMIYFGLFAVEGNGHKRTFFRDEGCGHPSRDYNNNITRQLVPPTPFDSVVGTLKPGSADNLEGSKTEKPTVGNSNSTQGNISRANTNVITIRWSLRRLPAKSR